MESGVDREGEEGRRDGSWSQERTCRGQSEGRRVLWGSVSGRKGTKASCSYDSGRNEVVKTVTTGRNETELGYFT